MTVTIALPQVDGRFWVTETQVRPDGETLTFPYLADPGTDVDATAAQRQSDLDAQDKALAVLVPSPITSVQARRVITAAGLRGAVEAAVAKADQATQDLWYTAETVDRSNPVLIALASAIGLSSDQLDNLFRQGARL